MRVAGVVGLILGSARRVGFVVVVVVVRWPLVAVFVGVRFGRGGMRENVLLSEIYVMACSEPLQSILSVTFHTTSKNVSKFPK